MNFDFLKDKADFKKLYNFAEEAEEFVISNPDVSAAASRKALESIVKSFYIAKYGSYPESSSLFELLDDGCFSSYLDDSMLSAVHLVRQIGNNAAHGEDVTKQEAMKSLEALYYSVCEILNMLGVISGYDKFDSTKCQKTENKPEESTKEIEKKNTVEETSSSFGKYKENIKDSIQLKAAIDFTEAETRKVYIDAALKEAGWDVWPIDNAIKPGKACIEIKLPGMPNESKVGYADYVLFDDDGKPLAVIEAKKAAEEEIVGSQQAKLYASLLKQIYGIEPVIYYTNGYKIMMIDGCGYPARRVYGYYTKDELHSLIIRRGLHQITDCRVDPSISDRPFIQNAVTSVAEALNNKHRKALLVMATGTGKTRCAISVVDVLQRNGWAKRILFLADRTALVTQAKRAFEKFLPHSSRSILSEETEEKRDYNATVVFSTYNTMSNILDRGERKMGIGHFDLIVIDECHRSVYNKYKAIFDYFDSLLLGLTATPREQVDASTYELFNLPKGEPTFYYDLDTAISAGYLVPFLPLEKTTKLLKNGIKYDELSEEERQQYDNLIGNPENDEAPKQLDGKEFYERIINSDTIDKMLQTVMNEGLRVKGGEELGKTIIFAVNHFHAEKIVERFKNLYPGKGENYCKLIDNYVNYAQTIIDDFSIKDKEPVIAVSVAMLDTGVDVPEVLNLVFFKRIYSKIKFWQMIGRGTRVCKGIDVMSPSKEFFLKKNEDASVTEHSDKQGFYIFDFCDNFGFFRMNPDGREPKNGLNLSQRIFNIKVDLIYTLQSQEHQSNPEHKAYYSKTKKELIKLVSKLNKGLVNVRMHLKYVDKYSKEESWDYLSVLDVKEVKNKLTELIDPNGDDETSKIFDLWLFNIELAYLEGGKDYSSAVQKVRTICGALLDKLSIPQVMNKKKELQEAFSTNFWKGITVDKLEKLREDVRELVKFLDKDIRAIIETNFSDEVIDIGSGTIPKMQFKNYKERVIDYLNENSDKNPVIKKIKNLEQLDSKDIDDLEHVFWKELGTKEEYDSVSNGKSLGVFIRKTVGLSTNKVNEVLSDYLKTYNFNSRQEEFLNEIVNFVRANGDIETKDLYESEPFKHQEYTDIFNGNTEPVYSFIELMHNSISMSATT